MRRQLLAVVAVSAAAVLGLLAPIPASAATTSTLVNFNGAGQQVVRFDTNGNAVDAHDGMMARFGGTYYLYGTSYNCGYRWQRNSSFCGFKVYSSPDLVHWTDRGFVVQPYQCGDCFRPHVVYDPGTRKYVLWTNDSSTAPGDFRVYTSNSPAGPFTQQPLPHLAYSDCGWDFTIYQDPATGRGYMVDTDCPDGAHGLVVQQLNPDDLSADGQYTVIHTPGPVEAPAMFFRRGTYYITMSDPTCGYCPATGTGYLTAGSPLGPWTGASSQGAPAWSIQNGQLYANGGNILLSRAGSSWSNYTYAADVTPLETGNIGGNSYAQAGMVFRFDDAGDGYGLLLSNYHYTSPAAPGYVVFLKYQGGNVVSIQPAALPFAVTGGTAYHVATTLSGNTISIAVNGTAVDTVTDSSYTSGRVGFREYGNESALFDNVKVTAPDGTVLLSDNFSDGLSQWAVPIVTTPYLVTRTSCGGQPSFVTTMPQTGGSPVYLYGSDLWDGSPNEGLANYFWAPLRFSAGGAIEPITCSPTATVNLAVGSPGQQAAVAGLDQTSGADGFTTTCDIAGGTEQMQTFTAGRTGTLQQVRFTSFQEATPPWTGQPPNAPLTLRLVSLNGRGGIGQILARQDFSPTSVGWSARNLVMTPDVPVRSGATYAIVASSATSAGCYGTAVNDSGPYPGGYAATSTDGGQTFTADQARDLKFLTVVGG